MNSLLGAMSERSRSGRPESGRADGRLFLLASTAALAVLSFGRLMSFRWVFWEDALWLISVYSTPSLDAFLDTGFRELVRVPQGIIVYYFLYLHKVMGNPFIVWNAANILTPLVSAVFLFLLVSNLSGGRHFFSFLVAAVFIIAPLDTTLPFYVVFLYRLSIMLSIISFYLTERGLVDDVKPLYILASFSLSTFAAVFLMEGVVALEPARLLLMAYMLRKKTAVREAVKKAFLLWAPFLFYCVVLSVIKLKFKPYGIYAGTYATSLSNFLNPKIHLTLISHLLFYVWFHFGMVYISHAGTHSYLIGFLSVAAGGAFMSRLKLSVSQNSIGVMKQDCGLVWKTFLFGLSLLIPPIILYEYVGNVPYSDHSSRHSIILEFGYAVSVGSLIYAAYLASSGSKWKTAMFKTLLVLGLGLGVFFHNLTLDIHSYMYAEQRRILKAFERRFPVLPDRAQFLFLKDTDYGAQLTMYQSIHYVFPLNMMYARSEKPEEFLRYTVLTYEEVKKELPGWKDSEGWVYESETLKYWGRWKFDSRELIVVYYKNGELLVNREVMKYFPYKWLDKQLPPMPSAVPEYPLRHRLAGV